MLVSNLFSEHMFVVVSEDTCVYNAHKPQTQAHMFWVLHNKKWKQKIIHLLSNRSGTLFVQKNINLKPSVSHLKQHQQKHVMSGMLSFVQCVRPWLLAKYNTNFDSRTNQASDVIGTCCSCRRPRASKPVHEGFNFFIYWDASTNVAPVLDPGHEKLKTHALCLGSQIAGVRWQRRLNFVRWCQIFVALQYEFAQFQPPSPPRVPRILSWLIDFGKICAPSGLCTLIKSVKVYEIHGL